MTSASRSQPKVYAMQKNRYMTALIDAHARCHPPFRRKNVEEWYVYIKQKTKRLNIIHTCMAQNPWIVSPYISVPFPLSCTFLFITPRANSNTPVPPTIAQSPSPSMVGPITWRVDPLNLHIKYHIKKQSQPNTSGFIIKELHYWRSVTKVFLWQIIQDSWICTPFHLCSGMFFARPLNHVRVGWIFTHRGADGSVAMIIFMNQVEGLVMVAASWFICW